MSLNGVPGESDKLLGKGGSFDDVPVAIPVAMPVSMVGLGEAPRGMDMTREPETLDEALGRVPGLLLRERVYWSQVAFGACEKKT
jgi:hypothetical protein